MAHKDDGTRSRILDAAGRIFSEQGYEKATIREIISRAEVNLSAVNYHFGDKERLYRATLRHAHEMAVAQSPLPEWSADTPPEVKLRGVVGTMLRRMLADQKLPWEARLMMQEFMHPTAAAQEVVDNYIRPHHEMLISILSDFLPESASTQFKQKLAFSVVGQSLFYKLSGPIVSMLVPEDDFKTFFNLEQLADHITNVMLAAFGRRPLFPTSIAEEILSSSSLSGSEITT